MKHVWRNLNSNRIMNRKYAKNYRHNMNIITFLKSNYKYKRRSPRCSISKKNQRQWYLPYRQQTPNEKHPLPANANSQTEDKRITKNISFRLEKFLRIFVLIMQQAISRHNNNNNKNNINNFYFRQSKSDNDILVTRLMAKIKAVNNANKKTLQNVNEKNKYEDGIIEYHRAYKEANSDTNININDEISHQQHNYDKVSTITSTLIKCQRRKHNQLKATNSSSSQLSQSPTMSFTITIATTSAMDTLLSTPSITNYESCQCTAILRHYVCEHSTAYQHHYHHKSKPKPIHNQHHNHHTPHINSLATRRMLNMKNSSNNSTIINSGSITLSGTGIRTSIQSADQYDNAGWNRSYTLSCLLLTLFIAFSSSIRSTAAGACWQTVLDNGKCNEIFSLNISKSECCGANQEFAYTKREPTNVEYFFATAIGGGMECSPCLENCMNVKCGPNKKCVKRKGRPKCVCAPECGAARRKRKHMDLLRQQQEPQHHTLRLVSSRVKEDNKKNVPSAIRSPSFFNIKLEKSQQSRDTRSLSSEITNINLALKNGKDAMINSDVTAPVERHYCKDHNQNQRKLIHMQMQHYNAHRQQQQYTHQINHKKQEPKGSRRLLIIANVEHTEKPTTRRLQIFSNVRTTKVRRQNSNNKKNKYGQHEGTDLSADDEKNDYNYNDAEDDVKEAKKKTGIIDNGNSNKNNGNNHSKRFLNQSPSRRKLKTNKKPNNKNNKNKNRNKNKNHHDLQTTKTRQHFNKNHTRVIHSQQNGRHTENTSPHRHHNHSNHQHHQHHQQQPQQRLQQEQHHNNHQQQSQNYSRHKHNNENKHHKQQSLVVKKPKNNKDYNITTTTSNNTNIAVVNTATTTAITKDSNLSNSNTDVTAIDATFSTLLQTRIVKITTTPTSLNLSSPSAAILPTATTTTLNTSPQDTQQQLIATSISSSFSSTTPLNSTMSADDGAAADDHYQSRLRNHGSKIATSSLLSAASSSSSSSSSHSQLSAVSARSSSELSVATTMSAKGEGVSFHDHDDRTVIQTKTIHKNKNNNNNNDDIISALQTDLHNNQQQDQQLQTQPQSPHRFHTPLFDSLSEQFDLIGFPNNKQQQHPVTHDDNVRPFNPVCGTDGRTYNTECQLRKRACRTDNPNLQISYLGHCRTTCNGVKCLNGLTCVEDQYSMPHCIACKIECPYDDYDNNVVDATRAVCGADGKTYKSTCDINRMICKIGRSIGVAYPGPCREDQVTCDDINCGPKQVCLMDLLTHKPRCTSCRYKCSRKRRPSSSHFDEGKICGFNNRTYNSWCEMRKDSCSTGFYIDVMYSGECH